MALKTANYSAVSAGKVYFGQSGDGPPKTTQPMTHISGIPSDTPASRVRVATIIWPNVTGDPEYDGTIRSFASAVNNNNGNAWPLQIPRADDPTLAGVTAADWAIFISEINKGSMSSVTAGLSSWDTISADLCANSTTNAGDQPGQLHNSTDGLVAWWSNRQHGPALEDSVTNAPVPPPTMGASVVPAPLPAVIPEGSVFVNAVDGLAWSYTSGAWVAVSKAVTVGAGKNPNGVSGPHAAGDILADTSLGIVWVYDGDWHHVDYPPVLPAGTSDLYLDTSVPAGSVAIREANAAGTAWQAAPSITLAPGDEFRDMVHRKVFVQETAGRKTATYPVTEQMVLFAADEAAAATVGANAKPRDVIVQQNPFKIYEVV